MRAARTALGKSQAEIAELAGVKDRETISQYESGLIVDIAPDVIPRLAMALGMPPQRLSRSPWGARDEGADLKVSNVARQIAYSFDRYPLAIQNQIRDTIAKYEHMVKQHGKDAADALFGPSPTQEPAKQPLRRTRAG
jgi:transcriptional regulator with XRE-family HTH domain